MPMLNKSTSVLWLLASLLLSSCQRMPIQQPAPDDEATVMAEPDSQVVAVDPLQLQYQQAMELARDGNLDEAISQLQQVIAVNPDHDQAYTNMGLMLLQQDRQKEAEQSLLAAIKRNNQDAVAYNHLAIIKRQQGKFSEAEQYYRQAIELEPNYANAHLNLGILLDIYLQQLAQALQHYQQYQQLTDNSNETVEKWIIDLQRRMK